MTRSIFTKVMCVLLTLVMLSGLAACGSKTDNSGTSATITDVTNLPDASGNVFVAEYVPIDESINSAIYNCTYTDKGIFTSSSVKTGTREPYEDEVVEYEGQLDVYETRAFLIDYQGKITELGYTAMELEAEEGHDISSYISLIMPCSKGFATIESVYESWSDASDDVVMYSEEWYNCYNYSEQFYYRVFDENGNELSRAVLQPDIEEGGYFYPSGATVTDDGHLVVGGDGGVRVFNTEGVEEFTIQCANWIEKVIASPDGKVYCAQYTETGYELNELDIEGRGFGAKLDIPSNCYDPVIGGGDYDLYYTSGSSLMGYDFKTKESTKLFSWLNLDVNSDNLSSVCALSDGSFITVCNNWDDSYENCTSELIHVVKKPASEVPEKIHLTLAGQYIDWQAKNQIIKFNRGNTQYHIDVIDYSEYNSEDDYSAGQTKLITEILSGTMPDILFLEGMPEDQLAARGLLENLYPYLDGDSELNRSDFFPAILKAKENLGELYSTISTFSLNTVCGAPSVVGDTPGWTYDQFTAALAQMPEGCEPFGMATTREEIMYYLLPFIISDLVDWNTGECNFNSQEFIDFLNFTAIFPESFDWENFDWTEYEDDSVRIMSGRQMLSIQYLYSFNDVQYADGIFGGESTFIGFPVDEGTGSLFNLNSGYAISAGSKYKDVAWEFLRTFFTVEYQVGTGYGFPSNINAFDAMAEKAMTPEYEKNPDGTYALDDNGERIKVSTSGMGSPDGGFISFYECSAEQVARVRDLIEGTTHVYGVYDSLQKIITDESAAFYAGQKSAEDVAKLVQSKINIYVNEQR